MLLEMEGSPDLVALDIRGDGKQKKSSKNSDSCYDPKMALLASLKEWFSEFKTFRRKPEHYQPVKDAKSIAKAIDAEQMGSDQEDVETTSGVPSPPRVEGVEGVIGNPPPSENFTFEDLCLMVDYFYLPHRHGEQAMLVLEEFCWLKANAPGYNLLQSYEKLKDDKDVECVNGVRDVEKMEPDDGLRSDGEACDSPLQEGMGLVDVSDYTA